MIQCWTQEMRSSARAGCSDRARARRAWQQAEACREVLTLALAESSAAKARKAWIVRAAVACAVWVLVNLRASLQ